MLTIAIDGPAGSGKSSIANILADRLNILHLDTGALYRAMAYKTFILNLDSDDEKTAKIIADNTDIDVKFENKTQLIFIDGKEVSKYIRTPEISKRASQISKFALIRQKILYLQRDLGERGDIVIDGRDICSNILPNAQYKFYLDASCEVRAKRRYKELIEKNEQVDYNKILQEIIERDKSDMTRKIAPLVRTPDSIYIDSSNMTIEQVINEFLKYIKE